MAKKAVKSEQMEARQEAFRRVALEKVGRKLGPFASSRLEGLNDDQWLALAKECRNKAGDCAAVLAIHGVQHLQQSK